jgi:threonyl-tRNA synthetase
MIVVGDQEAANGTVAPRRRHGPSGQPDAIPLDAFVAQIADEIATRRSA